MASFTYIRVESSTPVTLEILWTNTKSQTVFFKNPDAITGGTGDYFV